MLPASKVRTKYAAGKQSARSNLLFTPWPQCFSPTPAKSMPPAPSVCPATQGTRWNVSRQAYVSECRQQATFTWRTPPGAPLSSPQHQAGTDEHNQNSTQVRGRREQTNIKRRKARELREFAPASGRGRRRARRRPAPQKMPRRPAAGSPSRCRRLRRLPRASKAVGLLCVD